MPFVSSAACDKVAISRGAWSPANDIQQHEKRTGQRDAEWADWYAEYIVRERTGQPSPS
jgi:hypothetical protein